MPATKKAAQKAAKKPAKSFEESLWDTAMRDSANLETAGNPQVTSEAKNNLVHDGRWNGYDTPPTGNANDAWILHTVSKVSDWSGATEATRQGCPEGERGGAHQHGVAGSVLANGSMSSNTTGEGETLFIDARKVGSMISRTQKEFGVEDIAAIAKTYHAWRSEPDGRSEKKDGDFEDEAGYCKSATREDLRKHDYVLTPGRYVGAAALEDDGIPFETKMSQMSQTLFGQMEESAKLDEVIRDNLKGLGYGA